MTERGWRRTVAGLAGTAIGLAGLAFVARLALRERDALAGLWSDPHRGWLAIAFLFALLGMAGIGAVWGAIVRRLAGPDARFPLPLALRGHFVGQLGKYVPGGVWAVVGRGEWARRAGIPGPAAYLGTLLSMATAYTAACAFALLFLPALVFGGSRADLAASGVPVIAAVAALAPIAVALLHPRVAGAVLERLGRWSGRAARRVPLEPPTWSESAGFVARQLPFWFVIAGVNVVVARALGVDLDDQAVAVAAAVSWVVGFLALPVPGGIGVREATFAALLGGDGRVAAVALLARLVFVLVDLLGAAAATAWVAVSRPSQSGRSGGVAP